MELDVPEIDAEETEVLEVLEDAAADDIVVPLRTYNESRLPAPVIWLENNHCQIACKDNLPQNSAVLPAQFMLQSESGLMTLILPRTFPQ